jgi:Uma2 family endonuclease
MALTATFPTSTLPVDPASAPPGVSVYGEDRIVFRGVSWEVYDALSEAPTDGRHIRLAYDGKDLEIIMTISNVHENLKELVGTLVKALASWLTISYVCCGQTTWKSELVKRGLEADLSYYFDPEKVRIAREALARDSMERTDYPEPDLAVEIDISRSKVDRPSIYAAFKVSEIWRVARGRKPVIEHLQPDGSYAPVEASRFLPISIEEIHGWLTADDVTQEDVWYRRLNQWAMELGRRA